MESQTDDPRDSSNHYMQRKRPAGHSLEHKHSILDVSCIVYQPTSFAELKQFVRIMEEDLPKDESAAMLLVSSNV